MQVSSQCTYDHFAPLQQLFFTFSTVFNKLEDVYDCSNCAIKPAGFSYFHVEQGPPVIIINENNNFLFCSRHYAKWFASIISTSHINLKDEKLADGATGSEK